MKKLTILFVLMALNISYLKEARGAWPSFRIPRLIMGASTGYFRISLDKFSKFYDGRWDNYNSGQLSVRVYRSNYLTVQYARFQKRAEVNTNFFTGEAEWKERFINVGIRWYGETRRRWRIYSGFGFIFIKVEERAGLVLDPDNNNDVTTDGSGFFLEFGVDYIILPHVGLNLELEASSAGEGGTSGIIGSSLGGYAFLTGLNIHF